MLISKFKVFLIPTTNVDDRQKKNKHHCKYNTFFHTTQNLKRVLFRVMNIQLFLQFSRSYCIFHNIYKSYLEDIEIK